MLFKSKVICAEHRRFFEQLDTENPTDDDVFHDPVNESYPRDNPLTIPESTPPSYDSGGYTMTQTFTSETMIQTKHSWTQIAMNMQPWKWILTS